MLQLLEQQLQPVDGLARCVQAYTHSGMQQHLSGATVPYDAGRIHIHMLGYNAGNHQQMTQLKMVTHPITQSNEWTVVSTRSFRPLNNNDQHSPMELAFNLWQRLIQSTLSGPDAVLYVEMGKPDRDDCIQPRECSDHKIVRSYTHVIMNLGIDLLPITIGG